MFAENEFVYLSDQNDRKHWLKVSYSMIRLPSLGVIDGSRFRDLDDGSSLEIAGKRFTVFRPGTMELIESLERGAQIITPKDASTILLYSDIKAGDTVIEVGAGSGALTTALLRAVSSNGRVLTLELKQENADRALRNLKRTGLEGNWTCKMGDAREADVGDIVADALIMDMPDPENALDNLLPHLRAGGREILPKEGT